MASFKIFKGQEVTLANAAPYQDGAIYYCEDTNNAYIGKTDGSKEIFSSGVGRKYVIDEENLGGEIAGDYENNTADGIYSFVTGQGTQSEAVGSLIGGRYNISGEDVLFAIGNGTSSARSNAFTIDASGNAMVKNQLTASTVVATSKAVIPVFTANDNHTSTTPGEVWIVTA